MIPYTLHVTIILAVCLGFYKLLLGGQTYYRLNRLVLLACLVLAFVLPLIPVPQQFSLLKAEQANTPPPQTLVPVILTEQHTASGQHVANERYAAPTVQAAPKPAPETFNRQAIIQWAVWLYWFGMAAFGINFLLQAVVLVYQSWKNEAIRDGRYHIVELETDKAPCSFGNYIFINPEKYDWDTYNRILMHEKIHVKERHSIDLILTELMLVFQWFNPFAWLYRKTVENNLEFLTDDTLLQQHQVDPAAYQWSLLQVSVPNYAVRLATNYNQSLLKKRIMMMDAKRSDVHTLWKYVMLLPVLALLVCGLNKPVALSKPVIAKLAVPHVKTAITEPKTPVPAVKNLPVSHAKLIEPSVHQQVALILFAAGLITDTSDFTIAINRYALRVGGVLQPETTRRIIFKQLTAKKLMTDQLVIIGSPQTRGSNPAPYGSDTSTHPYGNGYVQPRANGYVQPHANGYIQPDSSYYAQHYGQYYNRAVAEMQKAHRAFVNDITADMLKDGLIQSTSCYFTLNDSVFIVNGKKQPEAVFEKYKQKYAHPIGGVPFYAERYGHYYTRRDTARRAAELATLKAITADMLKDGLITQTHKLSFALSGTSFTINGQKQPQGIFEKYKRKYVPAVSGPNWTWSHTHTDDASHNDIDSDN